jgi:hypothetical protein
MGQVLLSTPHWTKSSGGTCYAPIWGYGDANIGASGLNDSNMVQVPISIVGILTKIHVILLLYGRME